MGDRERILRRALNPDLEERRLGERLLRRAATLEVGRAVRGEDPARYTKADPRREDDHADET